MMPSIEPSDLAIPFANDYIVSPFTDNYIVIPSIEFSNLVISFTENYIVIPSTEDCIVIPD